MIFEVAHQMGLVPLVWLLALHWRGQTRDVSWWWLAIALGISWLADSAADLGAPSELASLVYQVSQSALIGAVLLDRDDAMMLAITLCVVGAVAVVWNRVAEPDALLSTVASLSVAAIAYERRALSRLRWSLLVTFGAGWACWMAYVIYPGWSAWLAYQGARLAGTALFCWAAYDPAPHFALSRSSSRKTRP